jgi:streptogramin lyase
VGSSAAPSSVRCYDGASGAFIASFVPPGSGGLDNLQNFTLGPDGDLYASDWNAGNVKRYDGATGAFKGVFASGGGLSRPDQVLFGPDANLYVSDRFAARILRFNGTSGAFMDVFVEDFRLGGFVGFTFGPDGNVYAGEFNGDEVLRFDGSTGAFMDVFAVPPPEIVSDSGIGFGPDGNLYVAGLNSDNVARFNGTTGALIDIFVPGGSGGLRGADYFTFGPDGNFYIDSQVTHQVKRYNGATGAFIDNFVSDSGLAAVKGIAFRPAGARSCGSLANRPPTVTASDAAGKEGAAIPISGAATDPDGDSLTTKWSVAPGAGVDAGAICNIAAAASLSTSIRCTDDGKYILKLTAGDGVNPPVSITAALTVANVVPSVAISSPTNDALFQLADTIALTAPFTDTGTNDTHTCSIDWDDGTVAVGKVGEALGSGTCTGSHAYATGGRKTIRVTISDDDGGLEAVAVTIDVNAPPSCSPVKPHDATLWPANHKLVTISVAGATGADPSEILTTTVTAVTQDEPLIGPPDAALVPGHPNEVNLRAERNGSGDGRVYRIAFKVDDGRGGSCTGRALVGVPHDQSGSPAIDSGLVVNSLG